MNTSAAPPPSALVGASPSWEAPSLRRGPSGPRPASSRSPASASPRFLFTPRPRRVPSRAPQDWRVRYITRRLLLHPTRDVAPATSLLFLQEWVREHKAPSPGRQPPPHVAPPQHLTATRPRESPPNRPRHRAARWRHRPRSSPSRSRPPSPLRPPTTPRCRRVRSR